MPVMAEIGEIARTLETIRPGKPMTHGALTVVPLLAPTLAESSWLTLAEAGDSVRITEVDETGAVPQLKVANLAEHPLLLIDGEELVGAKQNRVLNMTVLVAAHSELTIPVSCVEQGRWAYRGRHFEPADGSLFASLRQKKAAWVTRSVRAGRGHTSDQSGVWNELASKAAERGVASRTGAMRDFYQRYEKEMARARRALRPGRRARVPLGPLGRHGSRGERRSLHPRLAPTRRRLCGRRDRPEARLSPDRASRLTDRSALDLSRRGEPGGWSRHRVPSHWRAHGRGCARRRRSGRPLDGVPGYRRTVRTSDRRVGFVRRHREHTARNRGDVLRHTSTLSAWPGGSTIVKKNGPVCSVLQIWWHFPCSSIMWVRRVPMVERSA